MVNALKTLLGRIAGRKQADSTDAQDLVASRSVDIGGCRSVCLALGPYRNLTTLTAATLFLHPNCQVLNHAGGRIFDNPEVNFLTSYTRARLDRFIQFAITISAKGSRGNAGGSITLSHAFEEKYAMKNTFARSGAELVKKDIRCLFWKESLHTSNLIREKNVDLAAIFAADSRLRFLMPIRNPMDCAVSNLKTGLVDVFRGLRRDSPVADVTRAVLDEIHWFAELQRQFPDRFFYYFEHEISKDLLLRLAAFLGLAPEETWLNDALAVMKTKAGYTHDDALITAYRAQVASHFSAFPDLSRDLLKFVDAP